jgi:hypothetical protein
MKADITLGDSGIVASVRLCDGRTIRVCGLQEQSDTVLREIEKTFRWNVGEQIRREVGRMFR